MVLLIETNLPKLICHKDRAQDIKKVVKLYVIKGLDDVF